MWVACAVAIVVIGACSGGDDGGDAASNTTSPTVASGPTTTVRPVDTSFTGQNSTQFCTLARTYSERFSRFSGNPTPSELRTLTREGQQAINQAVNAAPAEIKRDVEIISGGFTTLVAELEKVNFEAARLPPAAFASLSAPEFAQATTRFQSYSRTVCGITG